jgi:hypothetical protein
VTVGTQTFELLTWIAARPRTYDETIEAWKTSCPRLPVWDDAVVEGLVVVIRETGGPATVSLTALGRTVLDRRP